MRLNNHLKLDEVLSMKKLERDAFYHMLDNLRDRKTFQELWPKVLKDCKPFLRELTKNGNKTFLYRGISRPDANAGLKKVRKDRKPMNTHYEIADIVDEIQSEMYGWKPRTEGMFASGSDRVASYYGPAYIVFPVGNFKFVYAKSEDSFKNWNSDKIANTARKFEDDIQDVYDSLPEKERNEIPNYANWRQNFTWDIASYLDIPAAKKLYRKTFEDILFNQMQYTDEDMLKGLQAGYEMIFKCDSYYYFNRKNFEYVLQYAVFN